MPRWQKYSFSDLDLDRFRENCSKVSVGQHRFTDQKKNLYSQSAFSSMQQMSQLAVIFNFMLWVKGSFLLVHLMVSFQFLQDTKVCCHLVFSSPWSGLQTTCGGGCNLKGPIDFTVKNINLSDLMTILWLLPFHFFFHFFLFKNPLRQCLNIC